MNTACEDVEIVRDVRGAVGRLSESCNSLDTAIQELIRRLQDVLGADAGEPNFPPKESRITQLGQDVYDHSWYVERMRAAVVNALDRLELP